MEGGFAHMLLAKGVRKEKRMLWVIDAVNDQTTFDELFRLLFHHEKSLILRAVEAVEKISARNPQYLTPHKAQVLALLTSGDHKELKSHMVKLLPRLEFTSEELPAVWNTISYWAKNPNENKTIRAGALQALYELSMNDPAHIKELHNTLHDVSREPIPSIQAKIKKLRRQTKLLE
jgi:hypothetical protein